MAFKRSGVRIPSAPLNTFQGCRWQPFLFEVVRGWCSAQRRSRNHYGIKDSGGFGIGRTPEWHSKGQGLKRSGIPSRRDESPQLHWLHFKAAVGSLFLFEVVRGCSPAQRRSRNHYGIKDSGGFGIGRALEWHSRGQGLKRSGIPSRRDESPQLHWTHFKAADGSLFYLRWFGAVAQRNGVLETTTESKIPVVSELEERPNGIQKVKV